jgi:hypothetical protein
VHATGTSWRELDLSLSGLDPVPLSKVGIRLLASLGRKGKIGTLLLASEMPVPISPCRAVVLYVQDPFPSKRGGGIMILERGDLGPPVVPGGQEDRYNF